MDHLGDLYFMIISQLLNTFRREMNVRVLVHFKIQPGLDQLYQGCQKREGATKANVM